MRSFGAAMGALYYTPHYADYGVHVRMPSAYAAWISSVPYCPVCGHTLKFKTMDDRAQKKTKASQRRRTFLFRAIFLASAYGTLRNLYLVPSHPFIILFTREFDEQIEEASHLGSRVSCRSYCYSRNNNRRKIRFYVTLADLDQLFRADFAKISRNNGGTRARSKLRNILRCSRSWVSIEREAPTIKASRFCRNRLSFICLCRVTS